MIKYIVKFAPEVTIKTRPVRKQFAQRLTANIEKIVRRHELSADVVKRWDMIEVLLAPKYREHEQSFRERGRLMARLLADMPGISHFLEVVEHTLADGRGSEVEQAPADSVLLLIAEYVLADCKERISERSFVVRCKRSGDHSFTSHEVERYVGGYLLEHSDAKGVQLKGADETVRIEIKRDRLFVVKERREGQGGYPLGTVGQVLSLISGGFDSSVASYETIRRGMETHFLFFNLGGHAHEVGVKQVSHYLWDRYSSSHRTAFVSVSFERVVEEILEKIANPLMGVVLKRMMVRAASQIAIQMKIPAIVTGESVSQVSSQTPQNLSVIEQACDLLVLRPLITSDKTEIMARARQIGVDGFAESMPEYCAVISDKPSTAAKLHRVEQAEANFDFDILEEAIAARTMVGIDSVYQNMQLLGEVELQALPSPEHVIIDLRNDEEREARPLVLHGNEQINIAPYRVNREFPSLDQNKRYLVYCEKGVMSRLHAAHLKAEGFDNIGVYQPKKNKGA